MSDPKGRVIGQSSAEVVEVAEMLASVVVGDTITYRDITKQIGVDVQARHRHILDSARRIVMRENNAVFAAERNVGLRRLSDIETVTIVPEHRRKRIRTQAKTGLREVATVNYAALPQEKQTAHNIGMAMLGTLHQATDRAAIKRLEHQVANSVMPNVDGTLKLVGWITD